MTEEQKAVLDGVFRRFGRPCDEWNETIYLYHRSAASMETCEAVQHEDGRAAQEIRCLQSKIDALKAHRIALAERYAELATAPVVPVVKLKRERRGDPSRVYYRLRFYDRYLNDGHEVERREEMQDFTGQERHRAISAYHEYVKAHPGIICEMSIEKPKWER